MVKIVEHESCYTQAMTCSKCEWAQMPDHFPLPPRSICPDCGENIKATVGKWLLKDTTSWYGNMTREYVRFIKKGGAQ